MRVSTMIISLILFSNLSNAQLPFIDDVEIFPKNYGSNLQEINNIVRGNYSHLKDKKINLDSLYVVYSSKVSQTESKDEYFKYLLNYFSELRNSHTILFLREYGIKASVKMIENRLFFRKVGDSILVAEGVSKNDEIIQIDGIPSIEWLNIQGKYVSASTPQGELKKTLWKVFNSEFKTPRTYKISTNDGIKTIHTKLEEPTIYSYTYPQDAAKCTGKKINETTGFIAINSMTGNVVNEFKANYDSISKLPNLIIDLRYNYGGNSGFSEQITEYLIKSKQVACVSGIELNPSTNNHKGKLFILIGAVTGSAAESFAIDLLESGNAILIGSPTGGDTGNRPSRFTTSYGVSFRIPTRKPPQVSYYKKFPMEGVGIPPHFIVKQTVIDFENGIDTVLEYTLNHINKTNM